MGPKSLMVLKKDRSKSSTDTKTHIYPEGVLKMIMEWPQDTRPQLMSTTTTNILFTLDLRKRLPILFFSKILPSDLSPHNSSSIIGKLLGKKCNKYI